MIRRHQPLITPRIPFEVQSLPPPPSITPRTNLSEKVKKPTESPTPPSRQLPAIHIVPAPFRELEQNEIQTGTQQKPNEDVQDTITSYESELSDLDDADEIVGRRSQATKASSRPDIAKIPKPPGEAGRPGCGGFKLEDALDWPKDLFTSVQKCAHDLVAELLDDTKSYNKQPTYKLDRICRKLEGEFPQLRNYENCWPIRCIVKAKLKSTSEIARRQGVRFVTGKVSKAVTANRIPSAPELDE
ncbi:hypothetical protein JOM56_014111 [Amanita muscaria]